MDTKHSAFTASLDVSQIQTLSQLSEEAFWNYARDLAGIAPFTHMQSTMRRKAEGLIHSSITCPPGRVEATASSFAQRECMEYLECVSHKGRYLLTLASLYEVVSPPRSYAFLPGSPIWMLGLAAWHGEPIAVIDLTRYLTGETGVTNEQLLPASLLIAHSGDLVLGLLVHSEGGVIPANDGPLELSRLLADDVVWYLRVRNDVIAGVYGDAIVLDVPALLTDVVRQIAMATRHE